MTIVKPTEALGKTASLIPHLGRHLYEFPKGVVFQEGNKDSLRIFLKTNRKLIESGYIEVIDKNAKTSKNDNPADMTSPPAEGEHNSSPNSQQQKKQRK